ncbi:MAG: hypothetical protein ACTS68_01935 [Candidatus Hodgkinia cicadicola]
MKLPSSFVRSFVHSFVRLFNFELSRQIGSTDLNSFHITFTILNKYSVIS